MELFEKEIDEMSIPLAHRLRPGKLSDVFGQDHLLADDGLIGRMLSQGKFSSLLFWGPPGCGKTTLALLIAKEMDAEFYQLSAVFSGVADMRKVFDTARQNKKMGRRTILFIDEIHRFNKAQQDSLLPVVEDGTVILIGATTENPSFELNSALLSRCRVCVLKRLDEKALAQLIEYAEKEVGQKLPLDQEACDRLIGMSDGDARYLLNAVSLLFDVVEKGKKLSVDNLMKLIQQRPNLSDKSGDEHYNLISAVHKSLRGSDPQAALYWVARMINSGQDPRYIFRRLTRFASEDIGLADPQAMVQAVTAWQAFERIGQPEGEIHLSHLVVYLALAPKSVGVYYAWNEVKVFAQQTGSLIPPQNILNAPTNLMKDLGYGKNYTYDPETKDGFSGDNYWPDGIDPQEFYRPFDRGFERDLKKRMDYFDNLRRKLKEK